MPRTVGDGVDADSSLDAVDVDRDAPQSLCLPLARLRFRHSLRLRDGALHRRRQRRREGRERAHGAERVDERIDRVPPEVHVRRVVRNPRRLELDPDIALLADTDRARRAGIGVERRVAHRLLDVREQVLRAPPPAGLLVADEREHQLPAPGIAELRQGDEREHQGRHARLHVAGAAPVDAPVLQVRPERVVLPPGLADRKGIEVAVEHEPAAGTRPSCPRDEVDGRRPADHAAMLDAGRGVEHGLDRFDHGGGIARRIGAVDPHQRPTQLDERLETRLDARRETRLHPVRAQSRRRVAARSRRETVKSVVERTNTPRAGAEMVSTSSP